jgi:hypothetical protein
MLARKRFKSMLMNVPHIFDINLLYAENLMKTTDLFTPSPLKQRRPSMIAGFMSNFGSDIPDAYVIVNTIRTEDMNSSQGDNGSKNSCHSTSKSSVAGASLSPTWNEHLRLTMSGSGFLVFNVFSKSVLSEDIFLGQLEIEIKNHPDLYLGHEKEFNLPLHSAIHPVYNKDGTIIEVPDVDSQGSLTFCINIPSIYNNMCGWWFDIRVNLFDVSGEKIWVVLHDNIFYVYDSPLENVLYRSVDGASIVSLKRTKYKLELEMECIELTLTGGEFIRWAWGNDKSKYRGLWIRALEHRIDIRKPKGNQNITSSEELSSSLVS